MRIRKYNGKDMQEALAKVRADLGVEAVILNSRKIKRRGIVAWFTKPYFEVLAAVDENFVPSPAARLNRPPAPGQRQAAWREPDNGVGGAAGVTAQVGTIVQERPSSAVDVSGFRDTAARLTPDQEPPRQPGRYGAAAYAAAKAHTPDPQQTRPLTSSMAAARDEVMNKGNEELEKLKEQVQSMAQLLERMQTAMPAEAPDRENDAQAHVVESQAESHVQRESVAAARAIPQQMSRQDPDRQAAATQAASSQAAKTQAALVKPFRPVESVPVPDVEKQPALSSRNEEGLSRMRQRLLSQEIDAELAERILGKVRDLVPDNASTDEIRRQTERVLAAALGEPETIRLREDGKPCVVALIGPTGVGKTTTLAKLAAEFSLAKGKKVGLITADTYRIAAVEQLKTYAEILNLPVSVVYAPTDMPSAIQGFSDKDVILVDTAGRSHRNRQQFDELRQLLHAAPIDEIYLVLSVNTGRAACQEVLEHYSFVRDYKLLFTKLDETPVSGVIFNARLRTGKRLSYVTAGQSVPDDLSVADSRGLAMVAAGTHA